VDGSGQTALHVAVTSRGLPVVAYLLERGARPDVQDAQGRTPLDVALGAGGRARGGAAPAVREDAASLLRRYLGPASGAPVSQP